MTNLLIAFITGLTTGGLSCLAVQGGLLASSLGQNMAGQLEKDLQKSAARSKKKKKGTPAKAAPRAELTAPILAFLAAKVAVYTLLGFLLGFAGQVFQFTPFTRAVMQIGIGIFMLGTALRMLNVHPIFRYFAVEPPAFIRRKLRKTAAGAEDSSLGTPVLLGLMTVLIPCGITQAMMAAAIGTGNPMQAAALMFAFTLGTTPVFFSVAYFATRLGAKLEKYFMRFVAVTVLVLALVTIDSGITLAGSPVSITRWVNSAFSKPEAVMVIPPEKELPASGPVLTDRSTEQPAAADSSAPEEVTINVLNYGYDPDTVHIKAGSPVTLRLVSDKVRSCSLAFMIPALGVQQYLESTGEMLIDIPAQEAGTRIPFSCSMGMFTGILVFDL